MTLVTLETPPLYSCTFHYSSTMAGASCGTFISQFLGFSDDGLGSCSAASYFSCGYSDKEDTRFATKLPEAIESEKEGSGLGFKQSETNVSYEKNSMSVPGK